MVLVRNLKFFFFFFFFFGKIGREKVFGDVLKRKLAVLAVKNIELKKSQNLHFFFSFLAKKGQAKVFGDVLDWKLAFLVYNNLVPRAFPLKNG